MLCRYGASLTTIVLAAVAVAGCNANNRSAEMETAAARRSTFIGQVAPPFALTDQDERLVRLADHRGRWLVLYFYPADDTPGCACQANEFTHLLTTFRDMNAAVLGVSGDSSASHRKFIAKYDLKLTLLSDPTREVMAAYGAWVQTRLGERTSSRVIRSTVIIDPAGVIRHHWPEVIPPGHADRVRARLAELQNPNPSGRACGCRSDPDA